MIAMYTVLSMYKQYALWWSLYTQCYQYKHSIHCDDRYVHSVINTHTTCTVMIAMYSVLPIYKIYKQYALWWSLCTVLSIQTQYALWWSLSTQCYQYTHSMHCDDCYVHSVINTQTVCTVMMASTQCYQYTNSMHCADRYIHSVINTYIVCTVMMASTQCYQYTHTICTVMIAMYTMLSIYT